MLLQPFQQFARIEAAGGQVVEEEEGSGSLNENVIDAMIHQVLADGPVPVGQDGDIELGSHTVGARHQD